MYSTEFEHYEIARRAERLRSLYMARMLAALPKAVSGLTKRGFHAVAEYLRREQARAELYAMNERELHDIGISRAQIDAVVRGYDPRIKPAETPVEPQAARSAATVVEAIEVARPANQQAAPAARDLDKAA